MTAAVVLAVVLAEVLTLVLEFVAGSAFFSKVLLTDCLLALVARLTLLHPRFGYGLG